MQMKMHSENILYAVVTSNMTDRMTTINLTWAPYVHHIRVYLNHECPYDKRVIKTAAWAVTKAATVRYRYPLALKHATQLATRKGIEWIMTVDDDTFVIPKNVDRHTRYATTILLDGKKLQTVGINTFWSHKLSPLRHPSTRLKPMTPFFDAFGIEA